MRGREVGKQKRGKGYNLKEGTKINKGKKEKDLERKGRSWSVEWRERSAHTCTHRGV